MDKTYDHQPGNQNSEDSDYYHDQAFLGDVPGDVLPEHIDYYELCIFTIIYKNFLHF